MRPCQVVHTLSSALTDEAALASGSRRDAGHRARAAPDLHWHNVPQVAVLRRAPPVSFVRCRLVWQDDGTR